MSRLFCESIIQLGKNYFCHLQNTLKRDQYVSSIWNLLVAFNPFVLKGWHCEIKRVDLYGNKYNADKYL